MVEMRWLGGLMLAAVLLTGCAPAATPSASPATGSSVTPSPSAPATAPTTPSAGAVVVNDSSLVRARTDYRPVGPNTFAVVGDTVVVADRVAGKLVSYRDGQRTDVVGLPERNAIDLAIQADQVWLLNAAGTTATEYRRSATGLQRTTQYRLSASADQLGWNGDELVVHVVASNRWVPVVPGSAAVVNPTFAFDGFTVQVSDGSLRFGLPARWQPTDARLLGRVGTDAFYLIGDSSTDETDKTVQHRYVYQVDATGRIVANYTLATGAAVQPPRDVQVTDSGVYQLVIGDNTVEIRRLQANS